MKKLIPGWPGAKNALFPRLFPYFPQDFDKWDYFEPFAGPATIVRCLPRRYHTETLCEISDSLTTLLIVIRDDVEALMSRLSESPLSCQGIYERERKLHIEKGEWNKLSMLERAEIFLRLCWNRYAARWRGSEHRDAGTFVGTHYIQRTTGEMKISRFISEQDLRQWAERLHHVTIFQGDAMPKIRDWVLPKSVFMYLDPPYLGEQVYIDQPVPDINWYTELFAVLMGEECKARWLMTLSLKDERLREIIPIKCHLKKMDGSLYKMSNCPGTERRSSGEYLIGNYLLSPQIPHEQDVLRLEIS